MLEKEKGRNKWKWTFQEKLKNCAFRVVGNHFFATMAFLRKVGHHFVFGRKVIFVDAICFWKMSLLSVTIQNHQTLQKLGFQQAHGENPKWHSWFQKGHFGKGPRKGVLLSGNTEAVFCWKHYFYSAFSKTQLCRKRKSVSWKAEFYQQWGAVCQHANRCFLYFIWGGGVLCLPQKLKKAVFLQFYRFFFLLPQKACLWNPSLLLVMVFSLFSFGLPFQSSIFLFAFCPSTSFCKTLILFCFSCLSFFFALPLLMFACFFKTNFPRIPFSNPCYFNFWLFLFSVAFVFVCMFYVSVFLFMLALFWVCFSLVIVLFFAFGVWKARFSLQF